jgi:hypothetical protein
VTGAGEPAEQHQDQISGNRPNTARNAQTTMTAMTMLMALFERATFRWLRKSV